MGLNNEPVVTPDVIVNPSDKGEGKVDVAINFNIDPINALNRYLAVRESHDSEKIVINMEPPRDKE